MLIAPVCIVFLYYAGPPPAAGWGANPVDVLIEQKEGWPLAKEV
jgi:hypothetical protein